jgi:hypothetical protein
MTQPTLFDAPVTPRPQPVRDEIVRLTANARRLLAYLQAHPGEWFTNVELTQPSVGAGLRAIGRLPEIKAWGERIEKRHDHKGQWSYRWMPK